MSELFMACPFCGTTDSVSVGISPESDDYAVVCWNCEVDGPEHHSKAKAIELWNRPSQRIAELEAALRKQDVTCPNCLEVFTFTREAVGDE